MPVAPRLSLVTLGVADVARSRAFYEALGWEVAAAFGDQFCVFRTYGGWLGLYPLDALRAETGLDAAEIPAGFRGLTLAANLDTPADVDEALALAVNAGGRVVRAAHEADWGGYTGYFADPDGHVWEVAYNPGWPIGPDNRPTVG